MNKIFGILRDGNFWLQLMVWVALFMMPFTFIRPMQDVTFGRFLLLSTHPCAILIVYYVNCYWLFPNYLKVAQTVLDIQCRYGCRIFPDGSSVDGLYVEA